MPPTILSQLKRLCIMRRKYYGIFAYDEKNNILGYCENSFSMSWNPDRVRVYIKEEIQWYFDNKKIPNNAFVLRITRDADNLGLEFDWAAWNAARRNAKLGDGKKSDRRNIKFKSIVNKGYSHGNLPTDC